MANLTELWSETGISVICGQAKLVKRGVYNFTTTGLTGTVAVGHSLIESVVARLIGASTTQSVTRGENLATFSATYTKYFYAPTTGVIASAGIIAPAVTSGSTSDSNNYTFGITNVTQTLTAVDSTNAANSNKATGGSALAADTLFAFTLGTAPNVAVTQGDLMKFVATKTGTYTVTEPTLSIVYTANGAYDEQLYWADTLKAGKFTPSASAPVVTLTRSSISPVSGRKLYVEITGF